MKHKPSHSESSPPEISIHGPIPIEELSPEMKDALAHMIEAAIKAVEEGQLPKPD